MPIATVRKALQEILLITPPDLDALVRRVMDEVIARHGFKTYTSYVAKVGRAQFIEIHIAVPPESADRQRGRSRRIGARDCRGDRRRESHRRLTIDFTADPKRL